MSSIGMKVNYECSNETHGNLCLKLQSWAAFIVPCSHPFNEGNDSIHYIWSNKSWSSNNCKAHESNEHCMICLWSWGERYCPISNFY